MKVTAKILLLSIFIECISASQIFGSDPEIRGQLSLWGIGSRAFGKWNKSLGIRYIPEAAIDYYLNDEMFFDADLSLNSFLSTDFDNSKSDVDLYRLKFRFATAQSETRIGLQKINFGPARLLRALRWFDTIDPTDPLSLTDGVYGLRFKYNFLDNSGLWLWALYGNDKIKGNEFLPSTKNKPEFGGRYQFPVPSGEFAFSFHRRNVNAESFDYNESRLAMDGRWDVELGFWFESVFQHNDSKKIKYEWNKMITVGADYTIGIGNGIFATAENMSFILSEEIFGSKNNTQLSALSASYPLSIFDNILALGFYSWEDERFRQYYQWQRVYDDFILSFSFFHYPENEISNINSTNNIIGAGYGIQLMVIYNH